MSLSNGEGCAKCPVKNCQTMQYRGSTCAAQRARLGIESDPMTFGEKIRSSDNDYLARQLYVFFVGGMKTMAGAYGLDMPTLDETKESLYLNVIMAELEKPYSEKEEEKQYDFET